MALPHFVIRLLSPQLAHPRGLGGRLVAALMNRGNARMNGAAIDALAVRDGDRVVDLGFGGGPNLRALVGRVGSGEVVGVEMSDTMIARAAATFVDEVAAKKLRFLVGTAESLPLEDASVDGLCTVNTVYFWTDRARALAELRRVMRPGGRLVVAFRPRASMEAMGVSARLFRNVDAEDVEAMLRDAGFVDLTTDRSEVPSDPWCLVRAIAPA